MKNQSMRLPWKEELMLKEIRKSICLCLLFFCVFSVACGSSNNAESTQPDPGLNAEESTADLEKTPK